MARRAKDAGRQHGDTKGLSITTDALTMLVLSELAKLPGIGSKAAAVRELARDSFARRRNDGRLTTGMLEYLRRTDPDAAAEYEQRHQVAEPAPTTMPAPLPPLPRAELFAPLPPSKPGRDPFAGWND